MATYYYSNCSIITSGCYLYTDPGLTNPVSSGYYSDGTNCIIVGSFGYVDSVSSCPSACPPFGTFLYSDCTIGPNCPNLELVFYYADGFCGAYSGGYSGLCCD